MLLNTTTKNNYYYDADVKGGLDYYPFGSLMPGRQSGGSDYRYGLGGQEKDDEIYNVEGSYLNYTFRGYNSRLGRFMAVDPIASSYPELTPYQFAGNTPIWASELEGLEPNYTTKENGDPLDAGTYDIASKSGTEDYFGWTWGNTSAKGAPVSNGWIQGSSTDFSRGNFETASGTTFGDNITGEGMNYSFTTTLENSTLEGSMRTALRDGTRGLSSDWGGFFFNKFKNGGGSSFTMKNGSELSTEVLNHSAFQAFSADFESRAIAYYQANGNLNGYGSNGGVMLRPPSFGSLTSSLSLATLMGGSQVARAQIIGLTTENGNVQLNINYYFYDTFGASVTDSGRPFPGLASQFVLQHQRNINNNLYRPFTWGIKVNNR